MSGIEPLNRSFADFCLAAWLQCRKLLAPTRMLFAVSRNCYSHPLPIILNLGIASSKLHSLKTTRHARYCAAKCTPKCFLPTQEYCNHPYCLILARKFFPLLRCKFPQRHLVEWIWCEISSHTRYQINISRSVWFFTWIFATVRLQLNLFLSITDRLAMRLIPPHIQIAHDRNRTGARHRHHSHLNEVVGFLSEPYAQRPFLCLQGLCKVFISFLIFVLHVVPPARSENLYKHTLSSEHPVEYVSPGIHLVGWATASAFQHLIAFPATGIRPQIRERQ